ncbi:MAG: substrate-binding domain-containing protein [Chloroflexota bacterium]
MHLHKPFVFLFALLVAGALACNLPFSSAAPTGVPAPTDSGFAPAPQTEAAGTEQPAAEQPAAEQPAGQATDDPSVTKQAAGTPGMKRVTLATVSLLRDDGPLQKIVDEFAADTGYQVVVEAGGAGRAFRLGEKYVADALLVSEPGSEQEFIANGFGRDRILIMHSDYVLLGPQADPAGIKGAAGGAEALKKIAETKSKMYTSEGESATSQAESRLWKAAGVTPDGEWYTKRSDGLVGLVRLASDKNAYVLAPRSVYLETKQKEPGFKLEVLVEGSNDLRENYHLLTGNPDKSPKINYAGAMALAQYLLSPEVQALFNSYGVDIYGEQIYFGDAGQ